MPLFQLAVCAIWRQHEGSAKRPTPPLTVSVKPVNYLQLQYELLPSAIYKTCSFSLINWGKVAKLVTGDGCSSLLVPVVHGSNVSAMAAQLEHPVDISQDGLRDLLRHRVTVTATEAKEAVPSALRTRRPGRVEVVGGVGEASSQDVTLTTRIAERFPEDDIAEDSRRLGVPQNVKDRRRSDVSVRSAVSRDEHTPGLALPIDAILSAVPSDLCQRQFSPLVNSAEQLVTPAPEQVSWQKNKADRHENDHIDKPTEKKNLHKRLKSGDRRHHGDKKTDSGRGKKEPILTFNMDFFFSGVEQLVACSALRLEAANLVQVALVLRAPDFLNAQRRLYLNPLVVHLRRLEGLPALPAASRDTRRRETLLEEAGPGDGTGTEEDGGPVPEADTAPRPVRFFAAVHMPDGNVFCSADHDYAQQVTLDELSVVFCGMLEREILWEGLQTVPLRLELLWRHATPLVSNKRFNQMQIDASIHDPSLVNIIKQSGNPFALHKPPPTKFAEVLIDVSPLTRGVRRLALEVPLTAVPGGPAASSGGTCPPPFRPLQLLSSAAQLSVAVSIAAPLDLLPRPAPVRCVFGRLLAVLSQRGTERSGVLQLIQRLNHQPSRAGGGAPTPGDLSTCVSGFCLRDRQQHLLFAEGRADAGLEQVITALQGLSRRDVRLCHHSGLLFAERLYSHRPPVFRVLEGRQLRTLLLDTRLYTTRKRQEQAQAVRNVGECFRTQWLSETLRQRLLPSEASLLSLQQLLVG